MDVNNKRSVMESTEKLVNFDSKALGGLRGISALHIVLFHSLIYCDFGFVTYGQVRFYDIFLNIKHDSLHIKFTPHMQRVLSHTRLHLIFKVESA